MRNVLHTIYLIANFLLLLVRLAFAPSLDHLVDKIGLNLFGEDFLLIKVTFFARVPFRYVNGAEYLILAFCASLNPIALKRHPTGTGRHLPDFILAS